MDDDDRQPGGGHDLPQLPDHLLPIGEGDLLVGDYRTPELHDRDRPRQSTRHSVHALAPAAGIFVKNASYPFLVSSSAAAGVACSSDGGIARTLPPPPAPVSFAPRHPKLRHRSTSWSSLLFEA